MVNPLERNRTRCALEGSAVGRVAFLCMVIRDGLRLRLHLSRRLKKSEGSVMWILGVN